METFSKPFSRRTFLRAHRRWRIVRRDKARVTARAGRSLADDPASPSSPLPIRVLLRFEKIGEGLYATIATVRRGYKRAATADFWSSRRCHHD